MKKIFSVTITYFNDIKGEWVTAPLSEVPDELTNPSATVADIAAMHEEMRAELKASYHKYDALEEEEYSELEELRQKEFLREKKAAEIEKAYQQRYA